MTTAETTDRPEQLPYVTEAGAAPTDIGQIPCFQVKLTGAAAMDDTNEEEICGIVREGMLDVHEQSLVVQTGKDVIEEGTEREVCCFWVYAYGSFGTFENGGMTYNVIECNPNWGVRAIPMGHADPMRVEAERFEWSAVPFTPDDFA